MVFSSLEFIFLFLTIVILVYYLVPSRYRMMRNVILLCASLFFYAWGEPSYVIIMMIEIIANYFLVLQMDKKEANRKFYLLCCVVIDLAALGYFKYANFFIFNLNRFLHTSFNLLNVTLPIGISFYTFQILSYVIDVYNKKVPVQKNLLLLATYVCLFPQLIAGPIVRYIDVENELLNRKETIDDFAIGLRRFIFGLGKKVIIANQMSAIADVLFKNVDGIQLNGLFALIGSVAFTLYIYYDFSGYSDMAIGLGRMCGFHFLENFNYPYTSSSVTEFWRRWHMSLSSWFRDYVYIPLGGNRVSTLKHVRNILVVWMLTGFWHGANWNFICWGLYYGMLLLIEKNFTGKYLKKLPVLNVLITFMIVNFGWIIFNANSMSQIKEITMLFFTNYKFNYLLFARADIIKSWPYFILAFIGMTPWFKNMFYKLNESKFGFVCDCYLLGILAICIVYMVTSSYNPFLYFRF